MARKKKSLSIETNDQNFGGSFNAHKNWRKLREKHRKDELHQARGGSRIWKPELYTPNSSAGKGDSQRDSNITKEEYNKKVDEFWENNSI